MISVEADAKAIRAVVTTWARATTGGDLTTILNLMTDDVVFLTPGNPPMLRDAFRKGFENMIRSVTVKAKPNVDGLDITVEGDMALSWGTLDIEITSLSGGPARTARGHTLTGFRRGPDGQWRIFRDANLLSAFTQA
jgi:uncharacterized protein (TIGR02246 family)